MASSAVSHSDDVEMVSSSDAPPTTATTTTFTPATRIGELNDTDVLISSLLSSAATATGILSNKARSADAAPSLPQAQERLTQAIDAFFASLNTIEVRLRRNIYALEEAGLIEAGDEKDAKRGRVLVGGGGGSTSTTTTTASTATATTTNAVGGGGTLDSSWLNARADNGVMAGVKKQAAAEVKAFLAEWKQDEGQKTAGE